VFIRGEGNLYDEQYIILITIGEESHSADFYDRYIFHHMVNKLTFNFLLHTLHI